MHKPIVLQDISLSFPNKICFEGLSTQIQPGSKIAITGINGSGKSTLLKIIKGSFPQTSGKVLNNTSLNFGYVPQTITDFKNISGGEKFNKALSGAFANHPDVLLLDEPTNHLDLKNRKSLMKMLSFFKGTLIVVSHDVELLRSCIDTVWHIDNGKITVFTGNYDDYRQKILQRRTELEDKLHSLKKDKRETHLSLMKEQQRAKKSKEKGKKLVEQKRWLPGVADAKQSIATKTAGKHNKHLIGNRDSIFQELQNLRIPEIIKPAFSLSAKEIGSKMIVSISQGSIGYENKIVAENINFSVSGGKHLAITGDNGSGKTTIFKAILNDPDVIKKGFWDTPEIEDIGYLDQHYGNLDETRSVFENMTDAAPSKTNQEIRDILHDFLFKKNEEVNKTVSLLSGGERARLSLAKISIKTPKLLLLDEITNNIDLETKEHITEVLKEYPGALIIISHDSAFLESIGIDDYFNIN